MKVSAQLRCELCAHTSVVCCGNARQGRVPHPTPAHESRARQWAGYTGLQRAHKMGNKAKGKWTRTKQSAVRSNQRATWVDKKRAAGTWETWGWLVVARPGTRVCVLVWRARHGHEDTRTNIETRTHAHTHTHPGTQAPGEQSRLLWLPWKCGNVETRRWWRWV